MPHETSDFISRDDLHDQGKSEAAACSVSPSNTSVDLSLSHNHLKMRVTVESGSGDTIRLSMDGECKPDEVEGFARAVMMRLIENAGRYSDLITIE